jgi:RNA polymerase sigma-70 factor, ECF subfamily
VGLDTDSKLGGAEPSLVELKLLTDDELMLQLQAGANDALAVLFERYERLIFSIAVKIVRDRGEAEDVTQSIFLEIYRRVAQFDPARGSLKLWLLQYAYHRSINRKQHLKTRSFYSQQALEDIEPFVPAERPNSSKYEKGELDRLIATRASHVGSTTEKGN